MFIIDSTMYQLVGVSQGLEPDETKFEPFFDSYVYLGGAFRSNNHDEDATNTGYDWTLYTADDNDFQIEFPMPYPTEKVEKSTSIGAETEKSMMVSPNSNINFGVVVTDYPEDYFKSGLVKREGAIQVLKFQIQTTMGARVTSEEKIQVAGADEAFEATFQVTGASAFENPELEIRSFIRNERAVMLMVLGERDSMNQEHIDRFFDSFAYLDID